MSAGTSDVVAHAATLVPVLAERAAQAERDRNLSPSTVDELRGSGLFELLVPAERGGGQDRFSTLTDAVRVLATGCTSTAWVAAFYAVHNWMIARFPTEAIDELYAGRPFVLAPAALSPDGRATVGDDGFVLNGRWRWGTGVMHAEWVMLTGIATQHRDMRDLKMFVVPRDAIEVVDTWHTDGMRATGSHDIVADGVEVPAHRVIESTLLMEGVAADDHPPFGDARYGLPLVPVFALVAAAAALGTAEGVVDAYRERTAERIMAYSMGAAAKDLPAPRMHLASARVRVESVAALFDAAVSELDSVTDQPRTLSMADRARFRHLAAHVVGESRRVTSDLCAAAGASVHSLDSPLQRSQRDINTLCGHVMFDEDTAGDLRGRTELGVELPFPSML